jgi:tRNA modification GTPase
MDLVQAEGVADLIDARVSGGARIAWTQLQGALSERLADFRRRLLDVLADIEANVDFSDDELPPEDDESRTAALQRIDEDIASMLGGFEAARRWRDGYRVVFTGRPNAGKSSLVNALLGHGRMIVSEEPGTTRDSVEEVVDLDGVAFVLTDTAGIRRAVGSAEAQAIEKAREKLANADIVVSVIDASSRPTEDDRAALSLRADGRHLAVMSKMDLPRVVSVQEVRAWIGEKIEIVETSAHTGEGCERLVAALRASVRPIGSDQRAAGITRVRHRVALEHVREAIGAALRLLAGEQQAELVCVELRQALGELAAITDPVDNEDVLDRIFSEFCIGK